MKNKKVILVFANYDYLKVLENWIYFIDQLKLFNYQIVALDKKIYNYLINNNIETIYKPCELDLGKLWIHRVEVIKEFIEKGYDVIHSDADAVWIEDPMNEFNNMESDLIFSQGTFWPLNIHKKWGFVLCCGLFMIKSNKETKAFLSKWLEKVKLDKDDQVSLNTLLYENEIVWNESKFYELEFRNKKFKCFDEKIDGKTKDGLQVTLLPHKNFQRVKEDSNHVYVKHIISEKNSESIIDVLKDNNCFIVKKENI